MKILHIFNNTNEKFSEPYIEFVNRNFDNREHCFNIIGIDIRSDKIIRSNVKYIVNLHYFELIKEMYNADKIILHGLMSPHIVLLLFLQPWMLRKCYWVIWGGDLYYYKYRKRNVKAVIYEALRTVIIKNMGNISALVKGDYDLAKKWYNTKAKYNKAIYMNNEGTEHLKRIVNISKRNRDSINILLGNSASHTNNHFEAIDFLRKFKDENIRIICPLSYGDSDYGNKVKKYGCEVFGKKFIYLDKFYSISDYMDILNTIDVGVFNHDRQQALGNIFSLLYLGKKVYMKNNTTMWDEVRNELGLVAFNIENLQTANLEQFAYIAEEDSIHNNKIIEKMYSNDFAIELWSKIFNG